VTLQKKYIRNRFFLAMPWYRNFVIFTIKLVPIAFSPWFVEFQYMKKVSSNTLTNSYYMYNTSIVIIRQWCTNTSCISNHCLNFCMGIRVVFIIMKRNLKQWWSTIPPILAIRYIKQNNKNVLFLVFDFNCDVLKLVNFESTETKDCFKIRRSLI
jgi:hypothetical protein